MAASSLGRTAGFPVTLYHKRPGNPIESMHKGELQMSYKAGIESTIMVKNIRNEMKIVPQEAFSALDAILKNMHMAYQNEQSRNLELFVEFDERYSPKIANEKKAEVRNRFSEKLSNDKRKMNAKIEQISESRATYRQRFYTAVPPESLVRYIDMLSERDSLNPTEWKMALKKVTESGYYQALVRLNDKVAKKFGYEFALPDDPEQAEQRDEEIKNIYTSIVDNIEKPQSEWSYMMFAILSNNENQVKQSIEENDTAYGRGEPDQSMSLRNKLKESAQHALHVGQYDLFREIYAFIHANEDQLGTEEEIKADFIASVEDMIEKGMSATEDKRTPYEKQRDKVITQLEEMSDAKKGNA